MKTNNNITMTIFRLICFLFIVLFVASCSQNEYTSANIKNKKKDNDV